jgi:hypothetical protein
VEGNAILAVDGLNLRLGLTGYQYPVVARGRLRDFFNLEPTVHIILEIVRSVKAGDIMGRNVMAAIGTTAAHP